jgi:hypothetical protein
MIKNKIKDSDLPCHTTDPWGRGARWGWAGWGGGELDEIVAPQLAPLRATTVQDRTRFETVG